MQVLQLASATSHRVCRVLGCCKLDGGPCIVMALYSKSAARRLDEAQGQIQAIHDLTCLLQKHQISLSLHAVLQLTVQLRATLYYVCYRLAMPLQGH